jgi:drug/metabolite transporter (DMT)-like permease
MWIRSAHYIIGALTLMLFIISGQYMGLRYESFTNPELYGHNEAVRYLFRANHIYLLLPAFINLLLGSYLTLAPSRGHRMAQYIGSALLLASTILLLAAFMIEPPQPSPERPLSYFGLIACFGGALLHLRFPKKE